MGNIPHETARLSSYHPLPNPNPPSHIIPVLTHSHLGHVTENSTCGYRWEIPHTGRPKSDRDFHMFTLTLCAGSSLERLQVENAQSNLWFQTRQIVGRRPGGLKFEDNKVWA